MQELVEAFIIALKLVFTGDPEVYSVTARTLAISTSSTLITAIIFVPLGCLIFFHEFRGKRIMVNLIQMLFSVPTVFVGLLVFIIFSRAGPLGGLGILFTPQVMVIGQIVLIAPIITGLSISALSGVGNEVKETAISMGASRSQAIWTMVTEVRYAMITAVFLGFGRALSEVGLALMVGGNIRGYTRTLTTAMSLETSMGNIEFSMALGIIVISVALIISIVANRFQQRQVR